MSYSDFVNTFSYGVNLFISSITSFANNFINNYIIITLIGLGVFVTLFSLILGILPFDKSNKRTNDVKYK